MGRVTKQKARKDWRCGKCGAVIKKGEEYYALHINYHPVRRRCLKCGFKSWELSTSYYVRTIGEIKDSLEKMDSSHVLMGQELSEIEEQLADLGNRLEEGIDSMPENLQDSFNVQERQTWLDELDEILDVFPDEEDEVTAQEILDMMANL